MAQIIRRKSDARSAQSPTEIRLEKAGKQMLKDSRELTLRKGNIDAEILNLRLSQVDAPVRKLTKK